MAAVLDHLAIGTPPLADGWGLFGGVLGGAWAYGGDSAGYWWGQLEFAAGPKIELLTPTGGPGGAFLDRFLAHRGAGPQHYSFLVTDIEGALARIRASGLEPLGVNLANPGWREAFLHPRSAHGIVIQVAQQGRPVRFDLIEHRISDLDRAMWLFRDVLDGRLEAAEPGTAELNADISGEIKNLRVNGVDVVPLVEKEQTVTTRTVSKCARPMPTGSAKHGTSLSGCGSRPSNGLAGWPRSAPGAG